MKEPPAVLGIFDRLDALHTALSRLQDREWKVLEVYSPVPSHQIEQSLESGPSPIRIFTVTGGVVGAAGGLLLAIWTSLKWNLITGGKPIVSIPPFLVIGFVLALLFGALATVVGFLFYAGLLRFGADPFYDPRFSEDHFGLLIASPAHQRADIVDFLWQMEAKEVHSVDQK